MVVEVQVPSGAQTKTKTMDKDEIYKKILEIVPNLDLFLRKNNVLEEYKMCLYEYNKYNKYNKLQSQEFIKASKNLVITYSFDWARGNSHLLLHNKNTVNWRTLHHDFSSNYKLYSVYKPKKIKII